MPSTGNCNKVANRPPRNMMMNTAQPTSRVVVHDELDKDAEGAQHTVELQQRAHEGDREVRHGDERDRQAHEDDAERRGEEVVHHSDEVHVEHPAPRDDAVREHAVADEREAEEDGGHHLGEALDDAVHDEVRRPDADGERGHEVQALPDGMELEVAAVHHVLRLAEDPGEEALHRGDADPRVAGDVVVGRVARARAEQLAAEPRAEHDEHQRVAVRTLRGDDGGSVDDGGEDGRHDALAVRGVDAVVRQAGEVRQPQQQRRKLHDVLHVLLLNVRRHR
mmetsp:Transcript_5264/g.16711  ORF Transcript_5264/g.16711 Transcript_5264/m.16711 type:complete len:279 (-) Transcript_5264:127-963(-)